MKIALVRHGQTEGNFTGRVQGRQNNELNDTGRRQCEKLKVKIKDKHFDYCYMSPLLRTVETAMILVGDRVETIPDKRLLERDLGELEGAEKELYDPVKYWNFDTNCGDLGVETIQDIYERCRSFLEYIKEKHAGQDILVVTHAAIYRMLRLLLLNKEVKGDLYDGFIENCAYEEFEVE